MSGFTSAIRAAVRDRDEHSCARCGRHVPKGRGSVQHRRPRAMGGSKDPVTNDMANLVLLCGHATEPGTCHEWAETERAEARRDGWLLWQSQDPLTSPVRTLAGVWRQPGERWRDAKAPEGATA